VAQKCTPILKKYTHVDKSALFYNAESNTTLAIKKERNTKIG